MATTPKYSKAIVDSNVGEEFHGSQKIEKGIKKIIDQIVNGGGHDYRATFIFYF